VNVAGGRREEYREAIRIQDKSLIRITPTRWVRSRLVDSRPTWPHDSAADQFGLGKREADAAEYDVGCSSSTSCCEDDIGHVPP
jgi:hypothetical protein